HDALPICSLRPSGPVVRAVALVLGVLVLAGGIAVWAMGLAPWWAAAGGGAGLLAALTVVRFSVATQRRRATSPVRAPKAQRAPRAGRRARKEARPARADERLRRSPSVVPAAAESETAGAAVTEAETLTERVTELYDVEAVSGSRADLVGMTATASSPDLTEVSAELDLPVDAVQERRPGTWAPVPVPPPTYTLKARAPRSQPGASFEDAQLPVDGNALALDEEFEELPPVHSVG